MSLLRVVPSKMATVSPIIFASGLSNVALNECELTDREKASLVEMLSPRRLVHTQAAQESLVESN